MINVGEPKISVYIPTRNRMHLVEQAVLSVLGQTYRDLEVIVVIDGSVDETRERLELLAYYDKRLRIISLPESRGAPAARNLAIRSARGEFVTGLDDDDIFLPSRLELFLNHWSLLRSTGIEPPFLYSQDLVLYDDGVIRRSRKVSGLDVAMLCEANGIGNQVFATRAALLDAGLFDETLPAWQDLELWLRLTECKGSGLLLDVASMQIGNDRRADRITQAGRQRILSSYEHIILKHRSLPGLSRQALFGQYLGGHYGFEIRLQDLIRYFSMGISMFAIHRLLRILKWRGWSVGEL